MSESAVAVAVTQTVAKSELIRAEMEAIQDEFGCLKPESVVERARDEDSVLHGYFIWDDTEAARMFRVAQAQMLIRRVKIEILRTTKQEEKKIAIETTRAYVSPPSIRGGASYIQVERAMEDEALREDLLSQAKRELLAYREKYRQLSELSVVWHAIESI